MLDHYQQTKNMLVSYSQNAPASSDECEPPGTEAPVEEPHGVRHRRVALTPAAAELLVRLTAIHGPLMFHQSGGCCDGSAPMCYPDGDFMTGDYDVHLGDLQVDGLEKPIGFWMSSRSTSTGATLT